MEKRANTFGMVLDALISRLHERGRLRVWSLVVTIFGDAIVPHGGRVSLSALQDVVARLGVEPGALRTAMSRLAADGWVEREKQGRNSFFHLDERGRHAFDLATRRIYAAGPPAWDGAWTVAIAAPGGNGAGSDLADAGFLKVAPGVHVRPRSASEIPADEALAGMLVIHGESAEHPETLRRLWPSRQIADSYQEFAEAYSPLDTVLTGGAAPCPLAAMAARALLIHDWRRIVLRDPGLPLALLPNDWSGEKARDRVSQIYDKLREQSEAWLEQAGLPPLSDPRKFADRFGRKQLE